MALLEKREGFPGQRIVVLPRPVVEQARTHALMEGVFPTDVGYFPHAAGHLRNRPSGVNEAVFIYCTRKSGWCEIDGRYHEVHSGDLLVVPPNTPHMYGADKNHPWSIHWFHAQGALLEPFLNELGLNAQRPVASVGESPQALALFEELLETIEHGYTLLRLLYASHTLAHLLVTFVRDGRKSHHEEPGPNQRVAQTIAYMKQHLKEPLQLNALAGVANLSRSQYAALFKEQTGYPPIDYLIRLRMHRACQLLDTTDLSVKTIAGEVGYEDPLYFSRIFRSVNEKSPAEYRRMRKG